MVFVFALTRNAERGRSGVIPVMDLDAWYVADQLMITELEAAEGLAAAIASNLLAPDDSDDTMIRIVGWSDEWARGSMTEAERKRLQRTRADVRTSPDACPDANGHGEREEKRKEEKKTDAASPLALAAVTEINRLSGTRYDPASKQVLKDCAAIAKTGATCEQVVAVINAKWHEWSTSDHMRLQFKPSALLRPKNFARYLEDLNARPPARPRLVLADTNELLINGEIVKVPA